MSLRIATCFVPETFVTEAETESAWSVTSAGTFSVEARSGGGAGWGKGLGGVEGREFADLDR